MSNFKLIKTAAALALGASVVTSAVVPTDASAASKYKIKNGKLVIAKTGKVAKGYVTYKSTVYKNGKKLTGLKGKTYYKAGKKATGTYKGAYYYKGAKKVTTGTYKGAYYVKGVKKVTTGLYNGRYYKAGQKATGTYKGAYYVKGTKKVTTGTYNGAYYVKGFKKVTTGLYKEEFYQDGKLSKGYAVYKSILYKDAVHNVGLTVFEGKLYDGVSLNKGTEVFEGKLYNGAVLSTGFVKHDDKFYNNGELANGEIDGVEYKDGVVVKYAVTSAKTINANEVKIDFSEKVSGSALDKSNYQVEINGTTTSNASSVTFVDGNEANTEGSTVIVRLTTPLSAGDKVVVQVKDKVTTTKGKSIERYASDVFTFDASAKPVLKSTNLAGDKLQFTFDRPVNVDTGLIKVDGVALTNTSIDLEGGATAGNYTYTTILVAPTAATKEGVHEVAIFDVAETARNNSQVASSVTGTYKVSKDEQAPEVKSVVGQNANRFVINFSEPVTLASLQSLVIKQGNHSYDVVDASSTTTAGFDTMVNGYSDSNAYITKFDGVSSITVVIPEAPKGKTYANPLYLGGASTATLDVTTKAFKDSSNLVGLESTKQVVLKKGEITPTFKTNEFVLFDGTNYKAASKVTTDDAKTAGLVATFDSTVEFAKDKADLESKVVVKNADGVVIPFETKSVENYEVDLSANLLTVKITNKQYQGSESYTVTLKKEAVKYKQELTTVSEYNFEQNKNLELTTKVSKEADSNFKYFGQKFDAKIVSKKNVFELAFGKELTDSALDAANYTLDGKPLPTGSKLVFIGNKKTVQITLPEQSVKSTTDYKLAVSTNVKTVDNQAVVNNLRDLDSAVATVGLFDNVSPTLKGAKYLVKNTDDKSSKVLQLTFDEEVAKLDKDDVKVLVGKSTTKANISSIVVGKGEDKNIVVVTLADEVNISQDVTVTIVKGEDNEITSFDKAGNKVAEGASAVAVANVSIVDTTLNDASQEAEAVVALEKAKTEAIKALDAYKTAEYDVADQATLKTAKEKAVKEIEAAKTDAELTTAKSNAKTALDAIKTTAQKAADQALADAKTALNDSINAAKAESGSAVEGSSVGQYPAVAISELNNAVSTAEVIFKDEKSTTQQLKDAKTVLDAAVVTFKGKVVTV